MAVPNSFATATTTIPLSNLDANFAYYDAAFAIAAGTLSVNYNFAVTGTVSGVGFSNYLASPPAIGGTAPAAAKFTTLTLTNDLLMTSGGELYITQPAPTGLAATSTLTVANMLTQIITGTSATPITFTLPTGTLMDGGVNAAMAADMSIDWSVINLGSVTGAITMAPAASGHTYVGNTTIAVGASASFRTRKTATATYITYRIA